MDACQIGGRFSRCHETASETCQYCGRPFCDGHAYFVEGHEAVCTRKGCRAKRDDLVAFEEFRVVATRRNRSGICGQEECEDRCRSECSLCHGAFCSEHVQVKTYPAANGAKVVSTCPTCWDRRKVWKSYG